MAVHLTRKSERKHLSFFVFYSVTVLSGRAGHVEKFLSQHNKPRLHEISAIVQKAYARVGSHPESRQSYRFVGCGSNTGI